MSPETAGHADTKAAVYNALLAGIRARHLPCHVFPDGMTVRIDETTAYEPDALVYCGDKLPPSAIEVPEPVIVAEVIPSSRQVDLAIKLAGYFLLPSLAHYLIVDPTRSLILHHSRTERRHPHPRRHRGCDCPRSAGAGTSPGGRLRRLNCQRSPAALVHEGHRRKKFVKTLPSHAGEAERARTFDYDWFSAAKPAPAGEHGRRHNPVSGFSQCEAKFCLRPPWRPSPVLLSPRRGRRSPTARR